MKIGIIPVNVGGSSVDAMIGLARKAESVGVESLWTFEHAIVPNDYSSKYPYSADGKRVEQSSTTRSRFTKIRMCWRMGEAPARGDHLQRFE